MGNLRPLGSLGRLSKENKRERKDKQKRNHDTLNVSHADEHELIDADSAS